MARSDRNAARGWNRGAWALVAVLAAAGTLGAANNNAPQNHKPSNAPANTQVVAAKRNAPARPNVKAAPNANANAPARPVTAAAAAVPAVRVAGASATGAPVVTAVPQSGPAHANLAHLDDHLTYQYNALGRRDPFSSLVDGSFVGADVGGEAPPDPGGIKVVGIVWGATDQFALAEDVRGNSFVLRKGDKVQNGVVEGLRRDGVIVSITAEGQTQSVVIPLVRKGDQNAR